MPALAGRGMAGEPWAENAVGLLWTPDAAQAPAEGALVIALYDGAIDQRGWRYGDQLNAAGIAVLHLEAEDSSADGAPAASAQGNGTALDRLAMVLDRLGKPGRPQQARVGLLAFGEAGQAAMLAASHPGLRERIGAVALLYPGCETLADSLGVADARPRAPVLLLHGEADPTTAPGSCRALADRLQRTTTVRRWQYRGTGYAWDLPPREDEVRVRLPWPNRPGALVTADPWPEAAAISAAQVASFFAATLAAGAP